MKKRNLIVFDIDGTLTDTVELHQAAFRISLNELGINTFNDAFDTYKHHTDLYIAKTIFEFATKQVFNKRIIEKFETCLYSYILQSEIKEIKGAAAVVNNIDTNTDFGICFATGSLYAPAKLKLEKVGIEFSAVQLVASNEIEEREKIIEKAIENAQKHYNIKRFERIVSFGDGVWDMKAADNLSLEFIGVGPSIQKRLKENNISRHIINFHELNLSRL